MVFIFFSNEGELIFICQTCLYFFQSLYYPSNFCFKELYLKNVSKKTNTSCYRPNSKEQSYRAQQKEQFKGGNNIWTLQGT